MDGINLHVNDSRLRVDLLGGKISCRSETGIPVVTGIGNCEKQHRNQHIFMPDVPGPGVTSLLGSRDPRNIVLGKELITTKEGERSRPGGYSINPSIQIQYGTFTVSCV